MTYDLDELGRRAVATSHWVWMAGMLAWRINRRGERIPVRILDSIDACPEVSDTRVNQEGLLSAGHAECTGWNKVEDLVPDFSDAATVGCLLQLVINAWKGKIIVRQGHKRWCIEGEGNAFTRGETWVEGLVFALEDALKPHGV